MGMVQILETAHFRNPSAHSSSRSSFGSFGSFGSFESFGSSRPLRSDGVSAPRVVVPVRLHRHPPAEERLPLDGTLLDAGGAAPVVRCRPIVRRRVAHQCHVQHHHLSMPVAERPAPRRCVILHDTPLDVRIPKPHRQRAAIPYVSPGQSQVVQGEVRGAVHVEDAAECGGVDGTHVAAAVRHVRAAATLADDGQSTKVPERRQGSTAEQDVRHQPDF
mmetsp:Transcript_12285/g.29725  ORF Transcript_12285/g.29725 Transcript_12285/m.29725 type:complete len:218 (-) Transcript_12285:262-915(-)